MSAGALVRSAPRRLRAPLPPPLPDAVAAVGARRKRRRVAADRRTLALGVLALASTGGLIAAEVARVWRRGSAPLPAETEHVLEAAEVAAREAVEVAVAGYREVSRAEAGLLNIVLAFTLTFGLVRAAAHVIRDRGALGPVRNLRLGRRHIHHFVPGIVLAALSGGVAIVGGSERLRPWLGVPFGIGIALTLDESALLLDLEDVYWSEQGVVSVQITLGAIGLLSSLGLGLRLLRRGEEQVLEQDAESPPAPAEDPAAAAEVEQPLPG